jgi:hypothetical protein
MKRGTEKGKNCKGNLIDKKNGKGKYAQKRGSEERKAAQEVNIEVFQYGKNIILRRGWG